MTRTAHYLLFVGSALSWLGSGCHHEPARTSPGAARDGNVPRVSVIATAHGLHMKAAFGYTYADLAGQIVAMKPGVVCAEVIAEDHGRREWMYPTETAVVEEAASRAGATFVPADWRPHGFSAQTTRAIRDMTPAERRRYGNAYHRFMPAFKMHFGPELFAFFHSPRAMALLRGAHDTMIDAATDIGAGFWDTRNQMIVKRCMRSALRSGARTVVFAFGGDHKYGIEEYLRRFYGVKAETVVKRHTHSNSPVAPAVISRWRARHAQLEKDLQEGAMPARLKGAYPARRLLRALAFSIAHRGVAQ